MNIRAFQLFRHFAFYLTLHFQIQFVTSHKLSNTGYVAVDELVLEAFEGDCNIQPAQAKPITTPATTTTPKTTTPTPNAGSCDFQADTCG